MKSGRRISTVLAICTPLLAWGDCRTLAQEVQDASRRGDVEALARYAKRIPTQPTCADDYRPQLARVAALGFVKETQKRIGRGATLAEQEALLRQSFSSVRTWQALAMLGDLEMGRKRYEDATMLYQETLSVINDPATTRNAPPAATIESVFRKAAESRLLAERYVAVPVNHRSGAAEGLALESVRGWEVKQVPIPITFVTDSTQLSPKGEQAARDLLAYVKQQNPPEITVVGHTDERGTNAHNQSLSQRRAEALADYLRREGFAGRIRTEGKGESQPIQLDDPVRYSQEEIWQLNRRVELVRK